jgi:hypothetical protein
MAADHAGVPRSMPMGVECAVHRHASWVPIERHHVWPLGLGGPDAAANKIPVCANGHYAIHELLDRLLKTGGQVPWEQRRHFGPKVRHYAQLGYEQAARQEPRR